jgi:phosphoribosylanthranilate isomerase
MTIALDRPKRTTIKFCGITNPRDAALAYEAGADAIGAIFAPSPRQVDLRMAGVLASARPRPPSLVAVVGEDLSIVPRLREAGYRIQFSAPIATSNARRWTHGESYLRVVHLCASDDTVVDAAFAPEEIPVFDTLSAERLGGTGCSFRWSRIAGIAARRNVVVAGGLDSSNVGDCIRSVRPFAVDVRSGIEIGERKAMAKMRAFVRAVREADAAVYAS